MINVQLLDECITEYKTLTSLDKLTEQQRGQKFNALIAKVLNAHQIYALADQRNKGEIDVVFRIKDKRFILEAKWESSRVNIDPIAKLGLRVNQRIPNNMGVILSMSGYTSDALEQTDQPGRPNILLLERDIFETLLHANIDAETLFDACVDVAAFEGKMHIRLSDIFRYLPKRTLDISIGSEIRTEVDERIDLLLRPENEISEYKILKAGLPTGQCGISLSNEAIFVTLTDGIYQLDKKQFVKTYAIDNPQNRCIFDSEKQMVYFVVNGSVMAIDKYNSPSSISKRYPGHVRLSKSNESINLVSNGEPFLEHPQPVKVIRDIAGNQDEMIYDYPIGSCVDACFVDEQSCAIIGSAGLRFYKGTNQIWSIDVLNGASISYLTEKIYFLENGVHLKSVNLDGKNVKSICKFNLPGSVGDFALMNQTEFAFHLYYHEDRRSKTAIVYVKIN